MKYLIIFLFLLFSNYGIAQESISNTSKSTDLFIGHWKIDLRPTPDSEAYFQFFKVNAIYGNTFKGTFYGSEIKNGLINKNWSKIYFAFSTSDQSNEYFHSGYMKDGRLFGISYCPKRDFTAPWTGAKE